MNETLTLLPDNITIPIHEGETLLHAIRNSKVPVHFETPCNGKGFCGKCKIHIENGRLSPVTEHEKKHLTEDELSSGIRLACLAACEAGGKITVSLIPKEGNDSVLSDYHLPEYSHRPMFGCGTGCGIAIDIGTTTIAAVLLDLESGQGLAKASCVNPQTKIGGDVLSRIEYTMSHEGGLCELSDMICTCIDEMTVKLLHDSQKEPESIKGYTIAANTTMLHLLLAVNPRSIAMAPYTPEFTEAQLVPASRLKLSHCAADAGVYCLPSVSAYIGADIVAGIYMSEIYKAGKNIMFIDIGTNGEIVLSVKDTLYSCSCAAGPALEGMNITCGMRAADGAIEHVDYENGRFQTATIGNAAPLGICGSGVLESVSALLKSGAVDKSGRISRTMPEALKPLVVQTQGNKKAFCLTDTEPPVLFSQADIRQVQLAKGAILSGFMALLERNKMTMEDLDEVVIAGQFGSYLDENTLIGTGILPENVRGKIRYIGNSSLSGAILCLLDKDVTETMAHIAKNVNYFELASYPDYTRLLMRCMEFPA